MDRRWIALGAAAFGLAILARPRKATAAVPTIGEPAATGEWVDADGPRRIRELAAPIEEVANWPGLGDFLAAVSWTESRGNSQATGDNGTSHGWFQLKKNTSRVNDLGLSTSDIYDEPTAVALAAWLAHRLRPFASKGQVIDWLAIRRGWKYPSRVSDVNEQNEGSRSTRKKFSTGLAEAGVPQSFMYKRAFPKGYAWPGIYAVFDAIGSPL